MHVLRLAKELNIPVEEREIHRNELYTADECFLTATPLEIVPVTYIDEHKVNGGKVGRITRRLQERYEQSISSDLYKITL